MLLQKKAKDFILHHIETLSQDGLAQVAQFIEFLQFRETAPIVRTDIPNAHVAFGIWSDYLDAQGPADFALKLREKIEKTVSRFES